MKKTILFIGVLVTIGCKPPLSPSQRAAARCGLTEIPQNCWTVCPSEPVPTKTGQFNGQRVCD